MALVNEATHSRPAFRSNLMPRPLDAVFCCPVCNKNVRKNQRGIQCDLCNFWLHMTCACLDVKSTFYQLNVPNYVSVPWLLLATLTLIFCNVVLTLLLISLLIVCTHMDFSPQSLDQPEY
jgi:hypothetical protein